MEGKLSGKGGKREKEGPPPKKKKKLQQPTLQLSQELKELSQRKRLDEALELYHSVPQVYRDVHHICILVDCCARCGNVLEAEKLMQNVSERSTELDTALLKVYAHAGKVHSCMKLFREMLQPKQRQPNVRTLNTLLRGMLWAATIEDGQGGHVGGVYSAREAWGLYQGERDISSFEYYITLLCQALCVEEATVMIESLQRKCSVSLRGKAAWTGGDQESLESLAGAYTSLARAFVLLGDGENMWTASQRALSAVRASRKLLDRKDSADAKDTKGGTKTAGGKRGFHNRNEDEKRTRSNMAFRGHRLSEHETEIKQLLKMRQHCQSERMRKRLAEALFSQLFYFSEKESIQNADSFSARWFSFGLSTLVDTKLRKAPPNSKTEVLVQEALCISRTKSRFKTNRIIPKRIFQDGSLPVAVELGSGHGHWIAHQACHNPSQNYIAVELRADRVAQTFSRILCSSKPIKNLCVVRSTAEQALSERILPGSVSTVFVNHPEPPTQTFEEESKSTGRKEASHMLQESTMKLMIKALKVKGRIVIVSDNLSHARRVCITAANILQQDPSIKSETASAMKKYRLIDVFEEGTVHLYSGQPGLDLGHAPSEDGSSYFDRLWRSGAGTHAQKTTRFIIALKRHT